MRKIYGFGLMLLFSIFVLFGCDSTNVRVTFDLNYEGALGAPAAQKITKDSSAIEPIEPSREGYVFIGWFKDLTDELPFDFETPIIKNLKLYAKWEALDEEGYFLGASFTSYNAKDPAYKMTKVPNEEDIYTFTVELTDQNRDKAYDGHYYKVTNGTWDADGCWGVDNYYINPAPTSPTGGGLGSIWHWANGTLTITFNAVTKEITDTLVIHEAIIEEVQPVIYGQFNSWVTDGEGTLLLEDLDLDGIYTGIWHFESAGSSDASVMVSKKWYDDEWGQRWGAELQYKFDGTISGMGNTTTITFEAGDYLFKYDSVSKETTYHKVEAGFIDEYKFPRIYGKFNTWNIDGANAVVLKEIEEGLFAVEIEFSEAGTSDFTIVLSRKWYDDEWGQRWGAELQYKLDGTLAGMGNASTFEYEVGTYLFEFDQETLLTTITKLEAGVIKEYKNPRIYGKFNTWSIDGANAVVLKENEEGQYIVEIEFSEAGTSDFTIVLSRKWYDDEWGKRWGAELQYKLDGTLAGMGNATSIDYEKGIYLFTFDKETHITTYTKIS